MKNVKKHLGKLYLPIGWSVLIFVLLALPGSMLPAETSFKIPQFDKIVHICLFGGFVLLWCLYYHLRPLSRKDMLRKFFLIFVIACAYGIGMEYVQKYFIPMRDFDTADIIADMIGAGLAYGICNTRFIE